MTVPMRHLQLLKLAPEQMVPAMDDIEGNGKNAATLALLTQLTAQLAEVKQQNNSIMTTQQSHSITMAEMKVTMGTFATMLDLQPVASKAQAAHERIDALTPQMVVLGKKIDGIAAEIATAKGGTWAFGKIAGYAALALVSIAAGVFLHYLG